MQLHDKTSTFIAEYKIFAIRSFENSWHFGHELNSDALPTTPSLAITPLGSKEFVYEYDTEELRDDDFVKLTMAIEMISRLMARPNNPNSF